MNIDNIQLIANTVIDMCDSTSDLARRLGESGFPHGTWVSARTQEKGRGRQGRSWISPRGGLFLSIVLRPERRDRMTWFPLAIAVGVVRALDRVFPDNGARIKWPNDIWIGNGKLAGILCEATGTAQGSFIIAGIGMNGTEAPEDLDPPAVALSVTDGSAQAVADLVRPVVVEEVLRALTELEVSGTGPLTRFYRTRSVFTPGTPIQWGEGNKKRTGSVIGLGGSGELIVRLKDGSEFPLYAEDVSVRPSEGGPSLKRR